MKVVMTIAGSDSGGGAGIQADLKTFEAFGLFGTSAITAVTAQNTLGVRGVWEIPAEGVGAQIDAILDDFELGAIKIGMLSNEGIVRLVADRLAPVSSSVPIVLDPVMVATSGDRLLATSAVDALRDELMPLARLTTPNLAEGRILADTTGDAEEVLQLLARRFSGAILLTGGDEIRPAEEGGGVVTDLFLEDRRLTRFESEAIETTSTHGTGCTLSSAIAALLALGHPLADAVEQAREYVREGLEHAPGLGQGHGPLRHSGAGSVL